MRKWTLALIAAILVSGCAQNTGDPVLQASAGPSTPSPSASEEPPVTLPAVTVTRTGGLAGMSDKYVVGADGALTVERHRQPPGPAGKKLTPDQQKQLAALVAAPALRAEASSPALRNRNCADGFVYTVIAGEATASGMDCGNLATDAPTLWKIVQLVMNAAGV